MNFLFQLGFIKFSAIKLFLIFFQIISVLFKSLFIFYIAFSCLEGMPKNKALNLFFFFKSYGY